MTSSSPIRAGTFTSSIGVEAQLNYTDGAYHNIANVLADLKYIGVDLVRAATLNSAGALGGQNDYGIAAAAGIKFDLVVNGNNPIASTLSQIDAFEKAHPGSVYAIEGPNEIDHSPITFNGLTGAAAAVNFQNAFYTAAENDSSLSGASIYSFSLGSGATPTGGYTQVAVHPYAAGGSEPLATLVNNLKLAPAGAATVVSETGYSTLPTWSSGVDQLTQEKLTLNTLFDAAKLGVQTTYLYELLDAYADPTGTVSGDHYGLFDINNNPKLAAVGLHNLMSILSDAGSNATTFQTANLNYTVANMPSTGSSLVMEKSSGAYDVVLWNEPQIWNSTTHTEIAAPTTQEVVNFGTNVAEVKVFDPLVGTAAIQDVTNVSQIMVAVTDHPVIIEVTGVGTLSNALFATANNQTLTSMAADPILVGGAFDTNMVATPRMNTTFMAGTGYDRMTGATSGTDTFVFKSIADSSPSHADLITGLYTSATDIIDLSAIDANTATTAIDPFTWVTGFDHHAGEAMLSYNAKTNITTLSLDQNGDGVADFSLQIHGQINSTTHIVL